MKSTDSSTEAVPPAVAADNRDGKAGGAPAGAASPPGSFCPNCDQPLPDGARLCTACGFNLVTGEQLEGASGAVPVEAPPGAAFWQTFLDFFPGFYYPGIILLAILCAGVACFLAVFTVFVFALGAFFSAGAIGVATLAVWTQAVTFMCVGRAEFFNTALGDIEGTQFGVFLGLVLFPPFAVWVLLGWLGNLGKG